MKRISAGLAIAMALMSCPSAALAAENIACVDEGYAQEEAAALDRFYDGFQLAQLEAGPSPEIVAAVTRRAGECADLHDWSGEAIEDAVFYRFSSIMRTALERHSPLSPSQLRRVSEAVAAADQERLNRIMGDVVEAAMNGRRTPELSDSDAIFVGRVLLRSGVPMTQGNGEYIGALIGARVMTERLRQRFATR